MTNEEKKEYQELRDKLKDELKFPKELNALNLVAVTLRFQQAVDELTEKSASN